MALPACSDEEFIALHNRVGPSATARQLGIGLRNVQRRRAALEAQGVKMESAPHETMPQRVHVNVENGVVLVGSDCHYWPGLISTAHRTFVRACRELRPVGVILNGDVLDGASISRHPPLGWDRSPTMQEEIEAVDERTQEIFNASPFAWHRRTQGNHDSRFEMKLAVAAPQFRGIQGFDFQDHLPEWDASISIWINNKVAVKHRWKGGVHAAHNNAVGSGLSIVTGHLHALKVTPYSDYTGTRYGVDTGTMAAVSGPQMAYAEDNPQNHRSGFAVLTFHEGRLLPPELVEVIDEERGLTAFRGKVYST